MDGAVVVEVLLDAEVAESALVERVLVDSAALVGGTLVVNLVLKASNGTERSGLAVAGRLFTVDITPDCIVEVVFILESPVIVLSDFIHVPVSIGGTTLLPFTGDLKWSIVVGIFTWESLFSGLGSGNGSNSCNSKELAHVVF